MNVHQQSLRELVEKWLSPTPATPLRVTQFSRTRDSNRRYVCVEVARPACSVAIMFFRHDDGSWRVFPPRRERPAMACPKAA
ncbi:hypothetical protein J8I87_02025 [Paraburkholderia sp. LEh10]|uniref:hypothetical protein n=1 Tax=Paraburkholderia sp. LEh10 TaxID=2821353 RepID=UPI001AEA2F8A|nr:hypothetical protein [Paraburkholderia sp. LEh10]MBP0588514.1 hypothetical protein [Paraburkholderia sp. LEh10]